MVLHESKIKELIQDKVVALIDQELKKYGFKYQKTKKYFIRQFNGFSQIISVYTTHSPVNYNEQTEQLHLIFNISAKLEMLDYEKWFFEKFGEKAYFSDDLERLTSQIALSYDDFDEKSFYKPTASQQFKRIISLHLTGGNSQQIDIIPIHEFLNTTIHNTVSTLIEKSDILRIYETSKYPLKYMFLLAYGGYTEFANEAFLQYYQRITNEIENKLKVSESEASKHIEELNKFIKNVQKVSSLSLENPFTSSIRISALQNDIFVFSKKTKFSEILRLDTSQFEIKSVTINQIGDILLFTGNQKIIKLNSKGELIFEKELESPKGFDKIYHEVPSSVIKGTNNFFLNNYIITNKNQFIELPLPIKKLKKGKLQNSHIDDLSFWDKKDKYLVVYECNLLIYSKNGELEKTVNIEQKYYRARIIVEKEWIITHNSKKSVTIILNFNGETVGTYECGNGNHLYEFSTNYEYLVCFFYLAKSQFYDLEKEKKGVLWAHPTFIKDYKEKMYNDINHNFGMSIAKFSPDNKYIVGGADHGKYVAWTLPKLERVELIPKGEMIELLEPEVRIRMSEDKPIITKAELVSLEGQIFLKNRGNDMSKIIFFENGDIFITELGHGKFVLSWNRNFVNLTFKKIDGRLDFHSQKFLTQSTKTELIIYELK